LVVSDCEGQQRPVRVSDVDALTVMDIDYRHLPAVGERPVEGTVVDRQPPALIEAQQQMSTRNQGVRDADVGPQIAPHYHVVTCREGVFRPVVPNG
jgi:hypothetical protein